VRYIVLRDLARSKPTDRLRIRDLGGPDRQPPAVSQAAEIRIDIETADVKGLNDLKLDPEVVATAASMPTRLIEPWESADQSTEYDSWGVAAVGATTSEFSGRGITIAVLDTGIDSTHPAFTGLTITEEDFSGSGNGDRSGHGTHCAGTILGKDVRGNRIGIARGVDRALIGKVLPDHGHGRSEMIFDGLRWAARQGAHVISMSLGFNFPGMVSGQVDAGWPVDLATSLALEAYRDNLRMFDSLMDTIRQQESFGPGSIVVAAAGNESQRHVNPDYVIAASLPAAAEGVVSAGALRQGKSDYAIAPFSNSYPTLCAPGVGIKSAWPGGGLKTMDGTSMACPHVAGVAALWWEAVRTRGLPRKASTVAARLLASCRLDSIVPDAETADRGNGLVTAP
jgi:subtilisin family serine protease